MRVTEIFRGNQWIEVAFSSLKKGDVFRLTEPDGEFVSEKGCTVFVANSDSYYSEDWETHMVDYETYSRGNG